MKIHLKQIPPEGLHLEGEEDCPLADLGSPDIECVGPLHYHLDLGISDGALWGTGAISQRVDLRCVSCSERFEHEISVPAFALHTELHGPETVNITPFMREDILLNLPPYPRCDRHGNRTCLGPKITISETGPGSPASAGKREHDWEKLNKLNLRG